LQASFPDDARPPSNLFWAKVVIDQLVLVGTIVRFLVDTGMAQDVYTSDYVLLISTMAGIFIVLAATLAEMYIGAANLSPALVCYWILYTICVIPFFKADLETIFEDQGGNQQLKIVGVVLLSLPLTIVLAILYSQAGRPRMGPPASPVEGASFISRLTFSWLSPIISTGFRRTLEQSDVPPPPSIVDPVLDARSFKHTWEKEQEQVGTRGKVSLWKVLWKLHGGQMASAAFLYLIHVACSFMDPQVLRLIIRHVENPEEETWKGIFYSLLLLISFIVYSFCYGHSVYQGKLVAIKVLKTLLSLLNLY